MLFYCLTSRQKSSNLLKSHDISSQNLFHLDISTFLFLSIKRTWKPVSFIPDWRKISRMLLLTLFRTTAFPDFLETLMAICENPSSFFFKRTLKDLNLINFPELTKDWISDFFLSRNFAPKSYIYLVAPIIAG